MKNLGIILIIFFFQINLAIADDTAFGGSGSSPVPIEKNEIKMIDEVVRIIGHQIDKENMQGDWQISCDFTFQNMTDKPITLNVGFPFPIYEEEGNVTSPTGKNVKVGSPLIYDFKVTVDGKSIEAKQTKIAPNTEKGLSYTNAYIWPMSFAPQKILKVHHDYKTGVTFNVLGHSMVTYVLKTGGLWQGGSIDSATFEIIPNTPTRLCSELESNPAEHLVPKPPGVKIEGSGKVRKYVWTFKNFKPTQDLDVCLQTGEAYIRYQYIYPIINNFNEEQKKLETMSQQELRLLRNTIYAQYGRRFDSLDLQNYFNQQWWYQPNPNYSDTMLTKEDKQAITLIQKVEATKGNSTK